jgi:glyoxylase-like metal-dependent hydrolase (beta-lactamase superfamily II)
MIDAGSDKKNLSKELDRLEIKAKKISAVFLTRTVEDHYGSLGLFKNAVIYMSRDEEQMIKGRTKHNNPIWKYGAYTLLNYNDSLNVDGLEIKILATPDNTPGSSYYVIGSGYLATGDNLVLKNRNPEQFAEKSDISIPTDPANYKYVLTSHYGFVRE